MKKSHFLFPDVSLPCNGFHRCIKVSWYTSIWISTNLWWECSSYLDFIEATKQAICLVLGEHRTVYGKYCDSLNSLWWLSSRFIHMQ
ncbi:unnamed protein product [Lactuca virosa]|uniref:Uncharacterized protein n=1 Tax=Lactuca virosa TaxID=75947 RepID=A0AAU9PSC2_9ASTR|nr:unnamed protein product [Lactuca virosa]